MVFVIVQLLLQKYVGALLVVTAKYYVLIQKDHQSVELDRRRT